MIKLTKKDGNAKIGTMLKQISGMMVMVGIPEEKSSRKKGIITNAELAYIHTNGSELKHIPARPIIEPAIQATGNVEPITEELGNAIKSIIDGDKIAAVRSLKRAGMIGQNAARAWFTDTRNNWEPNTPLTIARKGSDKPLIDTAQLRKSITYVVKE